MPAEFSLSDLEALNGTGDRAGAEKQRLKDLSKSITRYAEIGTPEPEPEPELEAIDENALLERVLKRAQEKMREAQNPTVLSTADIAAANEAKYGKPDQPIKEQALRKSIAPVKDEPDNFPLSSIISDAYDLGASDVYIQSDTPIRFKIGSGVSTYRVQPTPTRTDIARLLEAVVLDGDTTVFNANQELDIAYTVPKGKYAGRRCRLNVTYVSPSLGNINMVFRLLAGDILLPENYNVPEAFIKSMHSKGGLNVIAGVTGSGKTTTTASCLLYAQYNVTTPNPKTGEPMGVVIVTIEQPIEYLFDSNNPNGNGSIFIQREVNVDTISYLNGIKSALRQNPNIMLIGEARTEEEIQAAIRAAQTGHLTLTTVHALDCAGIIERLATSDKGDIRYNTLASIANVGRVFMTQALVKRIDGGLIPAHEVLEIKQSDRDLIDSIKTGNIANIRHRLQEEGHDMCTTLMELCRAGAPCYIQDVIEHAPDPNRLLQLIRTEEAAGGQFNYHPDALKNI